MAGPYLLVPVASPSGSIKRYAIGDTPVFQFDVLRSDAITPVTPVGPVVVGVINTRTNVVIGGVALTTIVGNRVVVTLPPNAGGGQFRASAQVTIDATPTVLTGTFDFAVTGPPGANLGPPAGPGHVSTLVVDGLSTLSGTTILGKDVRRSSQTVTEAVLVSGVDATAGELVAVTLTANRVVGLPLNPAVGQELVLLVTMGGAGNYKLTMPAGIKSAWQPSPVVGDVSALRLRYFGTNWQQIGGQVAVSQLGVLTHQGPAVLGSLTLVPPGSPNTNKLPGAPTIDTPQGVITGKVLDFGGELLNALAYGVKGDGKYVTDATITSGQAVVNSASASFVNLPVAQGGDVGKLACFQFAGAGSASIPTTIASVQSATQCTLAANAGATIAAGGFFMWASDDTAAFQAFLTDVTTKHARGYIPWAFYGINGLLTVADACRLDGAGLLELWGGMVHTNDQDVRPTIPPYFVGSVLWQFAQNTDGIRITAKGATVSGRDWGVLFAGMFGSTGHGVHFLPPVLGGNFDTSIVGAQWDSVKVFGHDGNHYGVRLLNPFNSTFRTMHSYGGGGLQVRGDTVLTLYGNVVVEDWYSNTFLDGTAHGVRLEASGLKNLNLMAFMRPQAWINVPFTPIPGTTPPQAGSAQLPLSVDANTHRIHYYAEDWETNSGAGIPATASGIIGQFHADADGNPANAMLYAIPGTETESGLLVRRASATATGDYLRWQNEAGVVLGKVDYQGILDLTRAAPNAVAAALGTTVGDKLALYSSGATGHGFGIQAHRIVAYMPSDAGLAVRVASAANEASSGTDAIAMMATGDLVIGSTGTIQLLNNRSVQQKDNGGTLRQIIGGFGNTLFVGANAGWTSLNFQAGVAGKDMVYSPTGDLSVFRGLLVAGDPGAGVASKLSLSNATGLGNGANTNLQAPAIGTGGGPASLVAASWAKVYDGVTTRWVPMYS